QGGRRRFDIADRKRNKRRNSVFHNGRSGQGRDDRRIIDRVDRQDQVGTDRTEIGVSDGNRNCRHAGLIGCRRNGHRPTATRSAKDNIVGGNQIGVRGLSSQSQKGGGGHGVGDSEGNGSDDGVLVDGLGGQSGDRWHGIA